MIYSKIVNIVLYLLKVRFLLEKGVMLFSCRFYEKEGVLSIAFNIHQYKPCYDAETMC